jgi:hypothetical protein
MLPVPSSPIGIAFAAITGRAYGKVLAYSFSLSSNCDLRISLALAMGRKQVFLSGGWDGAA